MRGFARYLSRRSAVVLPLIGLLCLTQALGWCLGGCSSGSGCVDEAKPVVHVTPPPRGVWSDTAWPLLVQLSTNLSPCQRANVYAGAAWWESMKGRTFFALDTMAQNQIDAYDVPPFRVITFEAGHTLSPGDIENCEIYRTNGTKIMVSVQCVLTDCSIRATTHALGHVLGLEDDETEGRLMSRIHTETSWLIDDGELKLLPDDKGVP